MCRQRTAAGSHSRRVVAYENRPFLFASGACSTSPSHLWRSQKSGCPIAPVISTERKKRSRPRVCALAPWPWRRTVRISHFCVLSATRRNGQAPNSVCMQRASTCPGQSDPRPCLDRPREVRCRSSARDGLRRANRRPGHPCAQGPTVAPCPGGACFRSSDGERQPIAGNLPLTCERVARAGEP